MDSNVDKKQQKPFIGNLEKTRKEHRNNSTIAIVVTVVLLLLMFLVVELGLI